MRKHFFLLFLATFFSFEKISAAAPTTKGTEFWFSFMENLNLSSNGMPKFSLEISCDVNTAGVISLPFTGFTQNFNAIAGQITEVFLPAGIFYHQGSESLDNCGFRVTSDNPISLRVMHHRAYFSDATIVLPTTELGDDYMVIGHKDDCNYLGMSEFVVEATEDNTTIDITPSYLTIGLRPQGVSFSVTMNKGQVYQVQSFGDLSGSSITARDGKKIAVFSGATFCCAVCSNTNHVYDESYPISGWGNEYLVMPLIPNTPDQFRILAKEDGTQIYFNCNAQIVLNKGQYFDALISQPTRITSTAAISVGQFKKGQDCTVLGDCSFFMNKPFRFCSHKSVISQINCAIPNFQFDNHYVNVIVQTANTSLFTIDNGTVGFTPVPSNPAYSTAHVSLNPGSHTLLSDSGFYAYAFGVGQYDSYAYFIGYDGTRETNESVSIQGTDTICSGSEANFIGNSSLAVSSWNWSFGDGGSSNTQNPSYTFSSNGNYNVTLLVTDGSGCPSAATHPVLVNHCDDGFDCDLFVPTAFSPNADGLNDFASVYGICVKEMDFTIYDRWGEVVFHSTDESKGWDGTYKGETLTDGVFAWTLKATSYQGNHILKKGNITIVK
jgi:gliding motility-associated-like protein